MKLVISTKSWHYRWFEIAKSISGKYSDDPKTLCSYFWSWLGFSFLAVAIVTTSLALCAYVILVIPVSAWSHWMNHSNVAGFFFYLHTALIALIGLIILGRYAYKKLESRMLNIRFKQLEETPLSGSDVFLKSIKAAKESICPFIEYRR